MKSDYQLNIEKYITFSVPIEKEVTKVYKKRAYISKTISYRLQFIDSARFMASSLSFTKFIKLSVNTEMMIKNVKLKELSTKITTAFCYKL